jgi:organic radical activating enzyme
MNQIFEFIKRAFVPEPPFEPLPPGFYFYQAPPDHPLNYKLHLRVEPDGRGLLIINASTVLHLNQTATEYAYHIVKQTPEEEATKLMHQRYQVDLDQIKTDFANLSSQIENLIILPDLDPVTYLDIERHTPYSDAITAPYRIDCALTYRLPESDDPGSAPIKRVDRELSTEEWKQILAKIWKAGIPHTIFTGGEPTLRKDLPELILYAEELGQVTGILTNGLSLGDSTYLQKLLNAGLDHTMIVLKPDLDKSWDSLASFAYWSDTMDEDLFVAVHLTLTAENQGEFNHLIEKLAEAGVSALSLSTNDVKLDDRLKEAQEFTYAKDIELVWDIPVPYSTLNPISLELTKDSNEGEQFLDGAGRGWLYIEPDGDVLPGQGINHKLGNLLTQDWEEVWSAAKQYWENR